MRPDIRPLLRASALLAAAFLALATIFAVARPTAAQAPYPSQPIRIIIGFTSGGITDTIARLVADAMSRELGVAVVIETRPGASGLVGAEACARAAPDGYTLCVGSGGVHSIHAHLGEPKLNWDPATAFEPISQLTSETTVLAVSSKLPIRNAAELVEWLRRNPNAHYATVGHGATGHLLTAALSRHLGLNLEPVPFRGPQQGIVAVIAGDIPIIASVAGALFGFISSGELTAIGVGSAVPNPSLPDVPPLSQTIAPPIRFTNYLGLFAPAGTPESVVSVVAATLKTAIANPAFRESIERLGTEPVFSTPAEFSAFLDEASEDFRTLVELSGIARRN